MNNLEIALALSCCDNRAVEFHRVYSCLFAVPNEQESAGNATEVRTCSIADLEKLELASTSPTLGIFTRTR